MKNGRFFGFGASCSSCKWGTYDIPNPFDEKLLLDDIARGEGPRHEDALVADTGEECSCPQCALGDVEAMRDLVFVPEESN